MIPANNHQPAPLSKRLKLTIFVLCLLVVAAGGAVGLRFVKTRPQPPQRPPAKIAPLVETTTVLSGQHTVIVDALGTVTPARQTDIRPEVAGTVREVAEGFVPGGLIPRGKPLLRLDDADFVLTLAAREAELLQARAALDLERGYQQVARHEWELLRRADDKTDNPDLALRKPQLAQALAKVRQAETGVEQARLDLKRTTMVAPFTGLIMEKNAEIGSRVSSQDVVATLVDTASYWVQATLPVDRLAWITFAEGGGSGSKVHITSPASGARAEGRLLTLRGDLENQGRMARLLITLPAPLAAKPAPFLIGEYVRLAIEGRTLDKVIALPRVALREDDTAWVVSDGVLRIRKIGIAWRDTHTVLVDRGLANGDRVITGTVATPIDGMSVTLTPDGGNRP